MGARRTRLGSRIEGNRRDRPLAIGERNYGNTRSPTLAAVGQFAGYAEALHLHLIRNLRVSALPRSMIGGQPSFIVSMHTAPQSLGRPRSPMSGTA